MHKAGRGHSVGPAVPKPAYAPAPVVMLSTGAIDFVPVKADLPPTDAHFTATGLRLKLFSQ